MSNDSKTAPQQDQYDLPVGISSIANAGEPIIISGVNFHGIAAESVEEGGHVEIITRAALVSTDAFFHRVVPNFVSTIENIARASGHSVDISGGRSVLLVIRKDDSAELWVDTAAVAAEVTMKRSAQAMTVIFDDDIADITGVWFHLANITSEDRIIYLFREGFRFAMAFDLRVDQPLDISDMKKIIASLQRKMKYADTYALISTSNMFDRMISAGWFPFVEIMISEFKSLSSLIESDASLNTAEIRLIDRFPEDRLVKMFDRWMTKPHFAGKKDLLWPGVQAFVRGEPIVTLKLILTEIEGILHSIYQYETGASTKNRRKLQRFLIESAIKRAGGDDTLLFPVGFMHYLNNYTFADSEKRNASRHAVSHGRADASDYTQARALQAILTLDQIAFYS